MKTFQASGADCPDDATRQSTTLAFSSVSTPAKGWSSKPAAFRSREFGK
jgi:hypothetical protein